MALIAQLGEHCTGIAEVVGSNPAQSLKKIFSGLCSSSVTAALALMTISIDTENNNTGKQYTKSETLHSKTVRSSIFLTPIIFCVFHHLVMF